MAAGILEGNLTAFFADVRALKSALESNFAVWTLASRQIDDGLDSNSIQRFALELERLRPLLPEPAPRGPVTTEVPTETLSLEALRRMDAELCDVEAAITREVDRRWEAPGRARMSTPSSISALAFYAKHSVIMDELYEADEQERLEYGFDEYASEEALPSELKDFVAVNASFLTQVIGRAMVELRPFESAMLASLTSRFQSRFVSLEKAQHDWVGKIWLSPKYAREKKLQVELGWVWNTIDKAYWIVPWIWMRGGRRAEAALMEAYRASGRDSVHTRPSKELTGNWVSGCLRVDPVNVTAHVREDFHLNPDAVRDDVLQSFEWFTEDVALELVKQLKKT